MPLQKLQFRPGINREGTNYSNEGGWFESVKIRFRSGFPEKIGGWTQAAPGSSYLGVCRSMVNWVDLSNNNLIGLGTNLKYYINGNLAAYHDITPIRATQTGLVNPFAVKTSNQIITVTDAAHGAGIGDFVTFSGATGFDGILASYLNSEFQIINVLDSNTYTVSLPAGVLPTGTGSGGGSSVTAVYQISIGLPAAATGNGWGAGVWNGANIYSYNTTLTYTSGTTPWILLDALSTTINVVATDSFPTSGTLLIDGELITYSGKTSTSFTGCVRGYDDTNTPGSTTISANISATDTTINIASIAGMPVPNLGSYAVVRIENELISYTGITATGVTPPQIYGCVRGISGTTAASHTSGSTIVEYGGVEHGYRPTDGVPDPINVYSVASYYGTTGWGQATTGAGTGVNQQMRIWTNDNYGQDLLFAPRGGPIYYWENNTSSWDRGISIQSLPGADGYAPTSTNQVVVSDVSRFVISMGSTPYPSGSFDPMLVRWSDQDNPADWNEADYTNQAGSQRLSNGSYIMQARKNRQENIIWTDSAIYSMQYIGPPYVWGFQLLMDNISIMGPNAAIVVNNVAYWMGTDKFYSYSGVVQTLPCALRQYIFDDISFEQRFQTVAGANEGFNEVWWFYVSQTEATLATQESRNPIIDKYVIYNHLERIWYYGTMRRTFWLSTGLQQYPLAAECNIPSGRANADANHVDVTSGSLMFHEDGVDDGSSSSPVPFDCYVGSSDFDIGDGHNFGYVWRIIPDVNFTGSTSGYPQVYMQVSPREFSGSPYSKTASTNTTSSQQYYQYLQQYIVQQYTPQVYSRIRGRQMSFRIGSGGQTGVAWQLGSPRIDIRPDGRR